MLTFSIVVVGLALAAVGVLAWALWRSTDRAFTLAERFADNISANSDQQLERMRIDAMRDMGHAPVPEQPRKPMPSGYGRGDGGADGVVIETGTYPTV
jgi:hypothetical protein